MPVETSTDVEKLRDVEDADGNAVPAANDAAYQSDASGVAVDAAGEILALDTHGKDTLDVAVDADDGSSAQYGIEAGPDGETWFGPFITSASGVEEWLETLDVGARFVRITVVLAASNGTTADVFLGAS
jgi:hypothetical protein